MGRRLREEGSGWNLWGQWPEDARRGMREALGITDKPSAAEKLKADVAAILAKDRTHAVELQEVRNLLDKATGPADKKSSEAEEFEGTVKQIRAILDGKEDDPMKAQKLQALVTGAADDRGRAESLRPGARLARRVLEHDKASGTAYAGFLSRIR